MVLVKYNPSTGKWETVGANALTLEGHAAGYFARASDIPTTLPANGGNADTVDSLHAKDIAAGFTDWSNYASIPQSADLNDYKTAGLFGCVSNAVAKTIVNTPFTSGGGYRLWVLPRTDSNILHIAISLTGAMMYRQFTGTWSAWKSIADGGAAATAESAGTSSATAGKSCLRNLASGTADASTANCPAGAWYGKHS